MATARRINPRGMFGKRNPHNAIEMANERTDRVSHLLSYKCKWIFQRRYIYLLFHYYPPIDDLILTEPAKQINSQKKS